MLQIKNIVKAEYYPFKSYKVSKLHKETAKRSITKEDIHRILKYESDNLYDKLSIDIFAFSYFTAETEKGNGRIDLKIEDSTIDTKIIEFKGWWNNDEKKIAGQINSYLTYFK